MVITGATRAVRTRARWTTLAAVVLLSAATTVTAVRVLTVGRGAHALTYDDVTYARVGQALGDNLSASAIAAWAAGPPHAPLAEVLATFAHLGPGTPQVLYVANAVVAALLLTAFAKTVIRSLPLALGVGAVLVVCPVGYVLANEFRPDSWFIVVAAVVLAGSVPYRSGPADHRMLPPWAVSSLLLLLLFIKPSWIALWLGVASLSAACAWVNRRPERSWKAPLALAVLGVSAWLAWLAPRIWHYLSRAVDEPYRVSASAQAAVRDSLVGAQAYLGIPVAALVLALAFSLSLLALSALTSPSDRARLLRMTASSIVLPAAAAWCLGLTAVTRHPSPFQGLLTLLVLWAWAMLLTVSALGFLHDARARARSVEAAIAVGAVLLLIVAIPMRTALTYPENTRVEQSAAVRIARELTLLAASAPAACPADTVLVTFAEDVNPETIAYYVAQGPEPIDVRGADMNEADVVALFEAAQEFDLVVTRTREGNPNGLPLNDLNEALSGLLATGGRFERVPRTGVPDGYEIFDGRSQSGCP